MHEAVPYEIREALGMPLADVPQACERIRTLRQTEVFAEHLRRSGRLCPPEAEKPKPRRALRIGAAFLVLAALIIALVLGWASLAGQPQGDTWKHRFQSNAHPHSDVEQLLRVARRERAAKND